MSGQDPADRRRADGPTVHGDAAAKRCVDDVIAEQDRSATTRRPRRVVHFRRRRQTCARCAVRVLGRAIGGQRHSVYIRKSIHTHPFNGPFPGTTRVSRYQKSKTNLDFTEARDREWQWHQLEHMQVCTSLQTDNHASTQPLSFLQAGCPSCRPTNSVKALKAYVNPSGILCTRLLQYYTIQYKFVKRHVAVASEALANRTVKKHRRRRTNVL